MPRPPLSAHVTDAHREWVAAAVAAPFHRPVSVPRLVHPRREKAPPVVRAPDLVDMMETPALTDEKPWYVRQGLPIDEVLRHHFGSLISPPTPLAQKRARLKRERAQIRTAGGAQGGRNTRR